MANSKDRSKFQKFDRKAETETFKRSSHNDFATSSELKERKFTGWRYNQMLEVMELWVLGEVTDTVTPAQYKLDPMIMEKVYAQRFAIY